jgi:hydrogenase expression/formation protein HypE
MDLDKKPVTLEGASCPLPLPHKNTIVMGHGSGGKMMQDLIQGRFYPPFENPVLKAGDDAGVVEIGGRQRLAISTDSHVVWPLFFPGGDIGRLAICGTVNDVAMMGATPLYLTAGFILEEGLDIQVLESVIDSMRIAAEEAGVQIVAGDTKVVERGKADGLYINTAGVGLIKGDKVIGGAQARPGDVVILSGNMGDHGIAVLSARGDLGLQAEVRSDIAPLNGMIAAMLEATDQVHVLRDPTRGGVATALNEIVQQAGVGIILDEARLPVSPPVQAACEILGFDPLYIANEGKLIAIVPAGAADTILRAMRETPYGRDAVQIGQVVAEPVRRVLIRTGFGSTRIVDRLMGEMLPRIC